MHAMNLSWRGPGVPVGAESRPRDVFARMFGDPREDRRHASILDVVGDDARRLKANLVRATRAGSTSTSNRCARWNGRSRHSSRSRRPRRRSPCPIGRRRACAITSGSCWTCSSSPCKPDFTRVATCALGDESEGGRGNDLRPPTGRFRHRPRTRRRTVEARISIGAITSAAMTRSRRCRSSRPSIAGTSSSWPISWEGCKSIREGGGDAARQQHRRLRLDQRRRQRAAAGRGTVCRMWRACSPAGVGGYCAARARLQYHGMRNQGVPLCNLWLTLLHRWRDWRAANSASAPGR